MAHFYEIYSAKRSYIIQELLHNPIPLIILVHDPILTVWNLLYFIAEIKVFCYRIEQIDAKSTVSDQASFHIDLFVHKWRLL